MHKKTTLRLLGGGPTNCGGGSCPSIYEDENGKIYIQGNKIVSSLKEQVLVANNEEIVELTQEMLEILKKL